MNKLTIAIPVYERFEYFEEALMSAVNQTASVNIIVVDNASTHNKFNESVKHLALPNIKYYRNDTNLGMYGNWNKCIEYCETDFVAIFGDDDILNPNYASTFYKALEDYPIIQFFHCAFERLYTNNSALIKETYMAPTGYHTGKQLIENALENTLNINTNGMIFSTSLFPKYSFQFLKWAYNQDYLFAYTAFADCVGFGSKECLLTLRVNPSGNALTVGAKAYLSTSLVYKAIKENKILLNTDIIKRAAYKERWVLRNAIISGNAHLLKDMMAENGNPFGINFKQLLAKDRLSKIALEVKGVIKVIIIAFMRMLRKLN